MSGSKATGTWVSDGKGRYDVATGRNYGTAIYSAVTNTQVPSVTNCEPMKCRFYDSTSDTAPNSANEGGRVYIEQPGAQYDHTACSANDHMRTSKNVNSDHPDKNSIVDTCAVKCANGYDSSTSPTTLMRCIYRSVIATGTKGIFYLDIPAGATTAPALITCVPRACATPTISPNNAFYNKDDCMSKVTANTCFVKCAVGYEGGAFLAEDCADHVSRSEHGTHS